MSETILQAMPQQEIPKRKPQSHKKYQETSRTELLSPKNGWHKQQSRQPLLQSHKNLANLLQSEK
jgi:hypothetical protein